MKNNFSSNKTGYDNLYPVFSFANYKETELFKENDVKDKKEFYRFFVHLQQFSTLTWRSIKNNSKQFHFHEIDNKMNIHLKLKINSSIDLIQFKLPSDKESRVVGYFDDKNVFNIIAYDYNHEIYLRK